MELWLREDFAELWRGKDPFQMAFTLEGETYRVLEQRQTLAFTANGKRYFIKRHRGATWGEVFKNLVTLRLPVVSARNEYRAIRRLHELGLRAPVIAAYGRRGATPGGLESFLITEDVGPNVTLEDYCGQWRTQPPGWLEKRALIAELAAISRTLHMHGVCHRDYYLCHFLRTAPGTPLTLIDLHRALLKRKLARRWIVKDLAGLYFSALDCGLTRHDLYRFMCAYRQASLRETLVNDRSLWEEVRARALRLYRKEGRGR